MGGVDRRRVAEGSAKIDGGERVPGVGQSDVTDERRHRLYIAHTGVEATVDGWRRWAREQ